MNWSTVFKVRVLLFTVAVIMLTAGIDGLLSKKSPGNLGLAEYLLLTTIGMSSLAIMLFGKFWLKRRFEKKPA